MADFSAAVALLEFQLTNELFNLKDKDNDRNVNGITEVISRIQKHRDTHLDFYTRFDYSWALLPQSYENPLSANYQLFLLEILADIDQNHPSYERLGNISVRFLPTASISPQCREIGGFKFILLPTAFVKLLQEFVWLVMQLRNLPDTPGRALIETDIFFGASVERHFRYNSDSAFCHLDRFLQVVFDYVQFEKPNQEPVFVYEAIGSGNSLESKYVDLGGLYVLVEMFVVCHELAHLLEHADYAHERDVQLEIAADRSAASLLIIHFAKHSYHRQGVILGPIAFFQIMRSVAIVRRLVRMLDRYSNASNSFTLDERITHHEHSLADENELVLRLHSYKKHLHDMGLSMFFGTKFDVLSRELSLLVASCQHRLLAKFGSGAPSWDVLLDTQLA